MFDEIKWLNGANNLLQLRNFDVRLTQSLFFVRRIHNAILSTGQVKVKLGKSAI